MSERTQLRWCATCKGHRPPKHVHPPSLFDFGELAEAAADALAGQELVTANVDDEWRKAADVAILRLARSHEPFTADDIRAAVGDPPSGKVNAMGARIGAASRRGDIVSVGSKHGTRKAQHARRLLVWRGRS